MKYTLMLITLCFLLFSCNEKETYITDIYGKWDVIGTIDTYNYLGQVEILKNSIRFESDDAVACDITDTTIVILATKNFSETSISYALKNNYLILTYEDGFTVVLYPEGKILPKPIPASKEGIIGSWKKENHSLTITANGDFLITGDDSLKYSVIEKGVLMIENRVRTGYLTSDGYHRSERGMPIDADEMYTTQKMLVPYSVEGDSLRIRYFGDFVTYVKE